MSQDRRHKGLRPDADETPPTGRCLYLAIALGDMLQIPGPECIKLAKRLYDSQFSLERPVTVELGPEARLADLTALCKEHGIKVRPLE